MNATLQRFCSKLASLGFSVFAQDKAPAKDGWITVHPNGKEHKGQHVEIDDETGGVKKGFGGKFKGQKISEIRSKFRGPQVNRLTERPDRKPKPAPMRTPASQTSAGQKLQSRLQDVLQKRQQEMEKIQTANAPTPAPATPSTAAPEFNLEDFVSKVKNMSFEESDAKALELKKKIEQYEKGELNLSEQELKNLALELKALKQGRWTALEYLRTFAERDVKFINERKELRSKASERRANQNPKTVAGVSQGKPMTLAEADGTSVNPKFSQGGGYRINCQTCTLAYELRCRGYDVEAKPQGDVAKGGSGALGKKLMTQSRHAYIDIETGLPPKMNMIECKDTRKRKSCMKMLDQIDSIIKPGERYAFSLRWSRMNSGHIFNLAKDNNGELHLIDSQSGVFTSGKDEAYQKYFAKTLNMKDVYIFRTDNTQITQEYQETMKRAGA